MLPEALAERIREACGGGLLLDARHARGIIADWRSVPDLAQRLKLCNFTRCVDYTLHELGLSSVRAEQRSAHLTPPSGGANEMTDRNGGFHPPQGGRSIAPPLLGTIFQFHLTLRAPEQAHCALHIKWKYTLDAGDPQPFPSLSRLWPSAGLAEREIFEMYGLPFAGNEKLTPLLLDEQLSGHPLRRDYSPPPAPSYAETLLKQRHETALLGMLWASLPSGGGFSRREEAAGTATKVAATGKESGGAL